MRKIQGFFILITGFLFLFQIGEIYGRSNFKEPPGKIKEIWSDVKISGGLLFKASNYKTEIWDITVDPPAQVSTIEYLPSFIPINIDVSKNWLAIYYYRGHDENGIYLYDISDPAHPRLWENFFMEKYFIQGGWIINGIKNPPFTGQFLLFEDNLVFSKLYKNVLDPGVGHPVIYDIKNKKLYDNFYCHGSGAFMPYAYGPIYYVIKDGYLIYSDTHSIFHYGHLSDFMDGDEDVCAGLMETYVFFSSVLAGWGIGPLAFYKDKLLLHFWARDFEGPGPPDPYILSGFMIITKYYTETPSYEPAPIEWVSDYTCTYEEKHGEETGLNYYNVRYDVQDLFVKDDHLYLSSYITQSIPHVDLDIPWGQYVNCQDYWEFYDLESPPLGLDGANGMLYVATADGVYDFPLARLDSTPMEGKFLGCQEEGEHLVCQGWAEDPQGVKGVFVYADGKRYVAKPDQGSHGIPLGMPQGYRWRVSIPIGTEGLKVIGEDRDHDFAIIYAGAPFIND